MSTATLPEAAERAKPALAPAAVAQPAPAAPPAAKPVYWPDRYCLLLWMAGAAILIALHVIDAVVRLLRLL